MNVAGQQPLMVPEMAIAAVPDDDRLWVPQAPNVWFRPLFLNTVNGEWVNLLRVTRSGVVSRHRHPAPVHGYVIRGQWRYLEHDWIAREGMYVFEPPGEGDGLGRTDVDLALPVLEFRLGDVIQVSCGEGVEGRHEPRVDPMGLPGVLMEQAVRRVELPGQLEEAPGAVDRLRERPLRARVEGKVLLDLFQEQVEEFASLVRRGGQPTVDGPTGALLTKLIEQMYSQRRQLEEPWLLYRSKLEGRHG